MARGRKDFLSLSVEHATDKSLPLNLLFHVVSGGHFVVCVLYVFFCGGEIETHISIFFYFFFLND